MKKDWSFSDMIWALKVSAICLCMYGLSGCHKNDDIPHQSPFDTPFTSVAPAYDFSPELADDAIRYVSPELVLKYDDGGILVQRNEHDDVSEVRFVELATGCIVEFSCTGVLKNGQLSDPRLSVDDKSMEIVSAQAHMVDKTGAWIEILAPGGKHVVIKY